MLFRLLFAGLTLHVANDSRQRGRQKMVCKKIVVIGITYRNAAPHSWIVSIRSVFVSNETKRGGDALISGRDIDETTKDACERGPVSR